MDTYNRKITWHLNKTTPTRQGLRANNYFDLSYDLLFSCFKVLIN